MHLQLVIRPRKSARQPSISSTSSPKSRQTFKMRPLVSVLVFCLAFLVAAVTCAPAAEDDDEPEVLLGDPRSMETPELPDEVEEIIVSERINELESGDIDESDLGGPWSDVEDLQLTKRETRAAVCRDSWNECHCRLWAGMNYCDSRRYRLFMTRYCAESCGLCTGEKTCEDIHPSKRFCPYIKKRGVTGILAETCCAKTYGFCSAEEEESTEDGELTEFEQNCLDNHNKKREADGAPEMYWCKACGEEATKYAKKLKANYDANPRSYPLKHSTQAERTWSVNGRNVVHGENLYWTWSSAPSCSGSSKFENAIEAWYDEKKYYKALRRRGRPVTPYGVRLYGHYTQMVWKGSVGVGCGRSGDAGNHILVCMYETAGNKLSTVLFNKNVPT
ncbi:GLIPR2 [Branchiostoma lanceolatum]|uniref:GLIPR2 protein n=1 Tax=Branchiostoma lanceolatum TaxID=7740 RepID=A0A8K0ENQ1_BRALA|nr:GLIPR2 [Branchiostoma lanceolatum]